MSKSVPEMKFRKSMGYVGEKRVPFLVIDDGDGVRLPEVHIDRVVLCCESHDALVAACKAYLGDDCTCKSTGGESNDPCPQCMVIAALALTQEYSQ